MRAREIREIRTLLLGGESVRLVAPQETGRTHLLDQIALEMETRGYSTFRVTGRRAFRDQPYVALREAGLVSLRGAQSESDIADELIQGLVSIAHPVLLIDDAEHLDLTSAYLLEQLRARRSIPVVVVSPPFVMLDAHGRAATNKIRTQARLELSPLGYAQISLLAQRVLGAPARPEVVAQVLAMSSGMMGVADSIFRSAVREQRIVQQESGWSLNADSLWNVHLRTTVEQLLGDLGRDEFRTLHAIALAESISTERLQEIAGESLITLSQRGLLTTFADANEGTQVAPRPSLISDYFQQQPIGPLHYEALALVRRLEDPAARDRALAYSSGQVARAKTFDRSENRGTGMARHQQAKAAHLLAQSAREWRRDPTVRNAVEYLDLLIASDAYVSGATRVLEHTPRTGTDQFALRLGLHQSFWLTQVDTADARGALRAFVESEQDPTLRAAFAAHEAFLLFSKLGMDASVAQWWEDSADLNDSFSVVFRHHIGVLTGQIEVPLAPEEIDPDFEVQRWVSTVSNTVLRSRHASPETYERELTEQFVTARASSDYRQITVSAYFLSQLQAATFRDLLATDTVSVTLAMGGSHLAFAHYFVAQLRWAAYVHYRHGEPDLARSVLAETARYPGIHGPLPAMHAAFGRAIEQLVEGERDAAVEELLAVSAESSRALLGDAAWTYAVVAFTERPTAEVFAQLKRVAPQTAHSTEPLLHLIECALGRAPEIAEFAQQMTRDAEIATAISLLTAIHQERRPAPEGAADPYQDVLADTVIELRALLAAGTAQIAAPHETPHATSAPLTKREYEIAMLAETLHNREIAERLSLSVRTVENHLARAMKKLGVTSRSELSTTLALTADR
ncbi:LuxR family transcriptional regulator [Leucobacter luti]|uniref:helix-turn-helix transcriptional regulator n=1 Tax=Leucobacter luti TaxID=340320 RepID=UPI001C68D8F7|nr:LuxR family transcriptional regulator [Leucobacter luti]QYM77152.1 LuxR C-terminal-related transcriptional regulator [Leucobacter luti]